MREEIEKQVSEKNQSQEKKTKGSLKVEDRCGKPLNCTVWWIYDEYYLSRFH